MAGNRSFGCFPSPSSVASVSKEDYKRLFMQTTNAKDFSWRVHGDDDRPENMDQVLSMGAKNTKYMRYQVKRAPLVDRTACSSNREFCPKPLGDHECNRELADTFKGPKRATSTPSVVKSTSSYGADFASPSRQQLRAAKGKSQAPDQARTRTLGGTGDFMVHKSTCHEVHMAPARGMALAGECIIPKPNLTLMAEPMPGQTSMYKDDFIGPAAVRQRMMNSRSAPNLKQPDLASLGLSFRPEHEEMFGTRRACFLSPGQ